MFTVLTESYCKLMMYRNSNRWSCNVPIEEYSLQLPGAHFMKALSLFRKANINLLHYYERLQFFKRNFRVHDPHKMANESWPKVHTFRWIYDIRYYSWLSCKLKVSPNIVYFWRTLNTYLNFSCCASLNIYIGNTDIRSVVSNLLISPIKRSLHAWCEKSK